MCSADSNFLQEPKIVFATEVTNDCLRIMFLNSIFMKNYKFDQMIPCMHMRLRDFCSPYYFLNNMVQC